MPESLYEKYGGFETVSKIVHAFYEEVLDSDVIGHRFADTDMKRQINHQTMFLCQVLGGPDNYKGRSLADSHYHLDISEAEFTEVATLLEECLEDAGMESGDVATVIGIVAAAKDQIIDPKRRAA